MLRPTILLRLSLLRHHADLLRQRRAPSRARLLDDRRRHPRPAPPPARRGRLLPDRDRRARRAGRPAGRGRGLTPRELGDRLAPRFKEMAAEDQRLQRLLHPHHRRGPRARSRRSSSASTTTATSTRASTRAGTARAAPTSRPSPRSARTTRCPIHKIPLTREKRGELVLPALVLPGARSSASTRSGPDFVSPTSAATRRSSFIKQGLQDVSLSRPTAELGGAGPLGPRPGDLRLVRRAAQLLHRAQLRARGRGPDRALLARLPHHRQGHPQVPRRLLARLPDGGRLSRCRRGCSSTASC